MNNIDDYLGITDYAALYNLNAQSVKKKCQRGGFATAKKIGRDWLIDRNEIPTDLRITTGEYKNWRKNK